MLDAVKAVARGCCPPFLWASLARLRRGFETSGPTGARTSPLSGTVPKSSEQNLDIYWDPIMAALLETWGEGTVWNEIKLLLADRQGRVLDIACGTGRTMWELVGYSALELHGCDISDLLIEKAVARGLPRDHLRVCDATRTGYPDGHFEHSYSIGSLEHFTDAGIVGFIRECRRITRGVAFHQMPVSRSGRDEGWMVDSAGQSFFNNSPDWWKAQFLRSYEAVYVVDSSWKADISVGKWFICLPERRS